MRFLGFVFIFASVFGFLGAFGAMHDALPKLFADATLRETAERCIADAWFRLALGLGALMFGGFCFVLKEVDEANRHMNAIEEKLDACVERLDSHILYQKFIDGDVIP